MATITNEHTEDAYIKFKEYYINNKNNFTNLDELSIINAVKQSINRNLEWNQNSLGMYIASLISMINGKVFKRSINSYSKQYFIGNLCRDFDQVICANSKKALHLHERYINGEDTPPSEPSKESTNKVKNIILYGAPGVGKTHNYQRIISMIENGTSEKEIFDTITDNKSNEQIEQNNDTFKTIKDDKRVEFVTFHQNYSYEDFIEGFRPNEDGNIKLEDGIFKNICDKAINNVNKSFITEKLVFSDALDILLKDKINNEDTIKINLKRDNSYFEIFDYDKKSIYYTRQGRDKNEKYHTLSVSTLNKMYNEEENNFLTGGLKTYYIPLLKELLQIGKENKVEQTEQKNFYIVIDEINRGNISKIFGELITLIEEDKRDNYEVTLPYSKESFKIPSNLYIIATMNSTDKSIATIDIALRRRFTFLKMKPNLELVENPQAKKLMENLNEYIYKNINEDYMLGHSYFMKVQNDEDLEFIKEYKIKPLLEEYFYADDDKLNEVLNMLGDK